MIVIVLTEKLDAVSADFLYGVLMEGGVLMARTLLEVDDETLTVLESHRPGNLFDLNVARRYSA